MSKSVDLPGSSDQPGSRYAQALVLGLTALLLFSLIEPRYPNSQLLQHGPMPVVLPLLFVTARRGWLSDRAMTCVFIFLVLHVVGARWIYSFVPGGERLGFLALGDEVQGRNHYDRLVHLVFGVLAVPIVVEVARRYGRLRPGWALAVAFLFVLGVSAAYEVFEWGLAVLADPDRAERYNGQQGDAWDAQKDMALAAAGALVALVPLALRQRSSVSANRAVRRADRVELEGGVVPSLLVRDMQQTLAFYRRIGFATTGEYPSAEAPTWAEVRRGPLVIELYIEPPVGTPKTPVFSGTLYVRADGVEALAVELADEVELAWGPELMDYGRREFAVRDPNGYLIAFTEPA